MNDHIGDTLSLDQLAVFAQVSVRQLNRSFRKKLNETTMSFYRNLRLEKARTLLHQTTLSSTEIALATGFSSSAHFSSAFRAKYNKMPSSCRS
ncbi:MAG: helix-turn-helix domain-containing protein, partial [Methylococcales bacterium]|nr:helix-turn-helix domain-containing protein [Methylococcales bacterium]